jgi:uridine phosphorylase
MGHRAATVCTIIAQRAELSASTDYKPFVEKMIEISLDILTKV